MNPVKATGWPAHVKPAPSVRRNGPPEEPARHGAAASAAGIRVGGGAAEGGGLGLWLELEVTAAAATEVDPPVASDALDAAPPTEPPPQPEMPVKATVAITTRAQRLAGPRLRPGREADIVECRRSDLGDVM